MRWNERVHIRDLKTRIGKSISLKGWIQFTRKSGKIRFFGLRDGSGIIQCVMVRDETDEAVFSLFSKLKQETSVKIIGIVQEAPKSQFGVEMLIEKISILGESENFPITPKEHGPDFLLSNRHLWLRSQKQVALLHIRSAVIRAMADFFEENHFLKMDSPILTKCVGEDASGLFDVDYFNLGKAYLAQTGQLYLESSIFSHGNVYCFGPTFRAEKSKTRRHLTEFWMLEGEMAFFDNQDNMDLQEDLIKYVIKKILEKCRWQLKKLDRDVVKLEQCLSEFSRLEYSEAVKILQGKGSKIQWGDDLGATDETLLIEGSSVPSFVYNYPKSVKAFYMKENPEDPRTVKCADLLAPEGFGEIIGGSQREDDHDKLLARIKEENLPVDNYQWYLDLRKYGSVEHSGFGLGLERLVGWICGVPHIRETIPFPRLMERITP
ncbi:MAG: asparagine--tRNA ligase [Proteobacteria bacterium]|nr:asparagine--tRNA ligase [Pseudomonadota bacterium]